MDYIWNISNTLLATGNFSDRVVLDEPLNCSDSFYFNNYSGQCVPECGWVTSRAERFVITAKLFASLAIAFPLLYFVLAITLQRHWLVAQLRCLLVMDCLYICRLRYPSIYYVFMNLDIFLFGKWYIHV